MVPIMTFMAFDAIEILAGAGTLARYGKKEARGVSRIFLRSRQDFTTASQGPRDKKKGKAGYGSCQAQGSSRPRTKSLRTQGSMARAASSCNISFAFSYMNGASRKAERLANFSVCTSLYSCNNRPVKSYTLNPSTKP